MAFAEENGFRSYLVLKVEHASLFGLLRLLFLSDLIKFENFCESSESGVPSDFRRRWIICISIFAQKMLLYLRRPMALLGYVIEMWLNLLSSNGGFGMLLLHLLKGTMVIPNKTSASFRSVIGYSDTRIDLDENIIHDVDDLKYGASLSIMAAKLSYENEACTRTVIEEHWKMEFLGHFNFWNDYQDKPSTQAIMFKDTTTSPNLIVVAFRGTEPFNADDWRTDVDISWYELQGVGKIHHGFTKALGLQKNASSPKNTDTSSGQRQFAYHTIREKLKEILQGNEGMKFVVTGHSLGGALAILFTGGLVLDEEAWLLARLNAVYTFGQPRVGDGQFAKFMEEKMRVYNVNYFRYVYCNDIVPRLPYDDQTLLYKHVGVCLYFNSCYKGKAMKEEPNKNYFSLFWAIPKMLNAVWELILSLIIPYIKGKDYKEGWFMRSARLIGLVFPGLVAHFPQNYNNVTRLGTLPSHIHLLETYPRAPKND